MHSVLDGEVAVSDENLLAAAQIEPVPFVGHPEVTLAGD
jgi:hypothetical protein